MTVVSDPFVFFLQTNCGGSAVILRRNSRLPSRSNSACESSTQNDKTKCGAFHSTRHSSLQRSDCDIRPKSSLYRGTISKQNSPVRGPHVTEHRRYSPRKPLSPSVSFSHSHSKKPPEAQDIVNANVCGIGVSDDKSMSLDGRCDSKGNEEFEANAIPAGVQSSTVGEDRSSSANIPPDSVSRSGHSGGGGGEPIVEGGEAGGGGALPKALSEATSSASTVTTTTGAAVTVPAVITTTSENVVHSEALASVETGQQNADGVLAMAPRRLPSADDDDDKERAVDTSPDGR